MSNRFISESDIEAQKNRIKEAWMATKKDSDPDEPPDVPIDNRSLFHRLEEQRLKKQQEYEDAHRLKNMIRGLEDDEIEFLDMVDRTKMEQEKKVREEELTALSEFRRRKAEVDIARASEQICAATASVVHSAAPNKKSKVSQKTLLSSVVKRKSDSQSLDSDSSAKRLRLESCESNAGLSDTKGFSVLNRDTSQASENSDTSKELMETPASNGSPPKRDCDATIGPDGYLQHVATLPGLGQYTDSSESDRNDSSDSDCDSVKPVQRYIPHRKKKTFSGEGCC